MTLQTLTAKEVIAGCHKALADGTLSALIPAPVNLYIHPEGWRCAVGVGFNKDTLSILTREPTFHTLPVNHLLGEVVDIPPEDRAIIRLIQMVHDSWRYRAHLASIGLVDEYGITKVSAVITSVPALAECVSRYPEFNREMFEGVLETCAEVVKRRQA